MVRWSTCFQSGWYSQKGELLSTLDTWTEIGGENLTPVSVCVCASNVCQAGSREGFSPRNSPRQPLNELNAHKARQKPLFLSRGVCTEQPKSKVVLCSALFASAFPPTLSLDLTPSARHRGGFPGYWSSPEMGDWWWPCRGTQDFTLTNNSLSTVISKSWFVEVLLIMSLSRAVEVSFHKILRGKDFKPQNEKHCCKLIVLK